MSAEDPRNQPQPGTEPLHADERNLDSNFLIGGKIIEQTAQEQLFRAAWFVQPENIGHYIANDSNFQNDQCYRTKIQSAFRNEREHGLDFAKQDYLTAIEAADCIDQNQIHQQRCEVARNVYAIDYKLQNPFTTVNREYRQGCRRVVRQESRQMTGAEMQQLTDQREANLRTEDQLYTAYLGPANSRINYGFALIRSGNVSEGEQFVREGISKRPEIEKDRAFQACWAKAREIAASKTLPQTQYETPAQPVQPTQPLQPLPEISFQPVPAKDKSQAKSPSWLPPVKPAMERPLEPVKVIQQPPVEQAPPNIPLVKDIPPAEIDFYNFHGEKGAEYPQDQSPIYNRQVDNNARNWLNYIENRPDFPAPIADTPKAPEPPPIPPETVTRTEVPTTTPPLPEPIAKPEAPTIAPPPPEPIAKPEAPITAPPQPVDQPKATDTVKDQSDWESYAKIFGLSVTAAGAAWAFHKYGLPLIRSLNERDRIGPLTDRAGVEERADIKRRRVLAKDVKTGEELSWDTYDAKNRQFIKTDGSSVEAKDAQFIMQIPADLPDNVKQAEIKRGKGELALRLAGNQNLVPLIDRTQTEATTAADGKDSLVIKHTDGTEKQILGTRGGKMQVSDGNKIVPIEPGANDQIILKVHGDAESVRQATEEARHIESLTKILCADTAPTAKTLSELEKKIVAEKEQFSDGEARLRQDKQALQQKTDVLDQADNALSAERAKLEKERVSVGEAETQLADRKAKLARNEITLEEANQELAKTDAKLKTLRAKSAQLAQEMNLPEEERIDIETLAEDSFYTEDDIDKTEKIRGEQAMDRQKQAVEVAKEKVAINKEAIALNQRKSDLADNLKVQDQKELEQVQKKQKLNQETDSVLRAEKVLREEQARNLAELEWLAEEKTKLANQEVETHKVRVETIDGDLKQRKTDRKPVSPEDERALEDERRVLNEKEAKLKEAQQEQETVRQTKTELTAKEQAREQSARTLELSNQHLQRNQAALTQSISTNNTTGLKHDHQELLTEQGRLLAEQAQAEQVLEDYLVAEAYLGDRTVKVDPTKDLKKIATVQKAIDETNAELEKAQTDLDTRSAKKEAEIKECENKLDPNKAVEQTELREWTALIYEERGDLLTEQEKLNERKAELLKRQAALDAASATKFPTGTETTDPTVAAEVERRKASQQKQTEQEASLETRKAATETRMAELIEKMQLVEATTDSKPSITPAAEPAATTEKATSPTQAELTVESLMLEQDYADLLAENKAEKKANLDVYQELFRARSQGLLKKNWPESTAERAVELTKFVQEFAKSTRLKNDPLAKNVTVIADSTNSNYLAVKHNGVEVEIKERNATHAQTVDGKSIPLNELSVELHMPEQYLAQAKNNTGGYDRAANHVLSSLYGQLYELNGLGQGETAAGKQAAQRSAYHLQYQLNGRTLADGQQPAPRAIELELNGKLLAMEAQGSETVAMTMDADGRVGMVVINNDGTIKQLDASNKTVEKTYDSMIKSVDTALEEAREQRNERLIESLETQKKGIEAARAKYLSDATHRAKVDGSFSKYMERVAKAVKSRPGQVVTVLFISGLALHQMHKEQPELGFDLDFEVKGTKTN